MSVLKLAVDNLSTFFHYLKPKEKINYRLKSWYVQLLDMLVGMFEYKIDQKENPYFDYTEMEKYLINEGQCGIAKSKDGIVVGRFSFDGGELDYNGRLTNGLVICKNGARFTGKIGKDIIWVRNNNLYEPDRDVQRFASVLSDVDLSYTYNIMYSRNCPIPIVKNSRLQKSIKHVLDQIFNNGKMEVAIDDVASITEMTGKSDKKWDVLNITDVTTSDKIQNLTMLTDYLLSRFCRYYGVEFSSNGKKAQQSVDEIAGYSQFSDIQPYTRLQWRKKALEEVKEQLGVEISIDFSKPFKNMMETIEKPKEEKEEPTEEVNKEKEIDEDEVKEDL